MSTNMKKTIAGKIPTDWNALLIKAFSSVVRGGSPRPAGSPKYFNGDFIPWITVADVTRADGMHLTKTKSMLTEEGSKHTRIIEPDTLLISNSGATLGVPKISKIRAGANDGVAMILSPNGVTNTYLYHFLSSKTDFLREHAAPGNGQPNLNTDIIGGIAVPIPPLPEQTAIASLLSTWDLAIEKAERLIAAKEKQFTSLVKSLITDKCENWNHLRADKVFKSISEKQNDHEELLSVTQDRGVIPRSMLEGRVMSPESGTDTYKLIKVGDFAISLRSFQGGIEYSRYQGLISPAYTVLRPKLEIDDDFYRHFFKSYLFIEKYLSIAVIGIRDGKQISIPDFMTVKIPLPPIEEQKKIAAILTTARQEIDLLKKQADAYRRQKRGLMQRLLTGEWRVQVENNL